MTDRFELLERIGRGGMGVVWKARDTESGRIVALKLLHEMFSVDEAYLERFEREVEIAKRIRSPHVVEVLGYGVLNERPFMAMEYVNGPSLKDYMKQQGRMDWERVKPVARDIANGLAAAHAAGVIHRDIKPSNILLTTGGHAKVADFGIAKALDLTALTGSSTMLGTPHYMAPEPQASTSSDLYSLGCVLYEMLTGRPPFTGDSQQGILLAHLSGDVDFKQVESGAARRLCERLLDRDPKTRPQIAADIAENIGSDVQPSKNAEVLDADNEVATFLRQMIVLLVAQVPLAFLVIAFLGWVV